MILLTLTENIFHNRIKIRIMEVYTMFDVYYEEDDE